MTGTSFELGINYWPSGASWCGAHAARDQHEWAHLVDVPVRIGAHLPSLTTTNPMRVDDLGGVLDEDVMHAYPLYSARARSLLDPGAVPTVLDVSPNEYYTDPGAHFGRLYARWIADRE